jgi:futalosine hydrolase
MSSPPHDPGRALLCVPTAFERSILERVAPDLFAGEGAPGVELVGFGPVAAAARTAALIAQRRPARIILLGIAGSLEGGPALGEAAEFGAVALDGVGAGQGHALLPPSALGFPQWQDAGGEVHERLQLPVQGPLLLSVCAASATVSEALGRRERFEGAAAEDMETFGAALAARMAGVPLHAVRGISNVAGDRDKGRWLIEPALAAAASSARSILEEGAS